ncbi:phosphatidylethanolamine-binding protein [Pyrenochaeta sp. MPI-SDFR-AT-0127]|nr:phosphatidylethanolamine-binding protein [Pyrenochaeta sp. MPI-SDFR-AT-0127]
MYISSSLFVAAVVGLAQAQTPPGFKPQVNTKLEIAFNSTSVSTPGQMLSKAATASQPRIAVASAKNNASDTFVYVMLDLDVPGEGKNATRRVLLHAMNIGYKATQQKTNGSATVLASTEKGPASYLPPGPPATDTMAHRYVQLLFQQPANFNVKASDFADIKARINFDIDSFGAKNGLGTPIAANYFRVDGRTGGNATGTGGMPKPTLPTFEGAAGRMEICTGLIGLVGGLALLGL